MKDEVIPMLRSVNELHGYGLHATDGDIGHVDEFYFDDQTWTVRYLVAGTGNWLPGKKVLISPIAIAEADWGLRKLNVNLTREQVKNAPGAEEHRPLSRRWEARYHAYYEWPAYWAGAALWGVAAYPSLLAEQEPEWKGDAGQNDEDSHLQSTRDVTGYTIHASDGDIGHVADFLVDDKDWAIRYLVVDTRSWLPGKKVLLSPGWIECVKWDDAKVHTHLSCEAIRSSPAYDPKFPLTRDDEIALFAHYGQTKYWDLDDD
jgi:hypothetical protein